MTIIQDTNLYLTCQQLDQLIATYASTHNASITINQNTETFTISLYINYQLYSYEHNSLEAILSWLQGITTLEANQNQEKADYQEHQEHINEYVSEARHRKLDEFLTRAKSEGKI